MTWAGRGFWFAVVLGAILRLWNLDHGFPDWWARPDEANIATRILKMWAAGGLAPGWFEYPALWLYLMAGLYHLAYLWGEWTSRDAFVAAYVADPTHWILAARAVSAICGVATIAVVHRLGSRLGGDRVGWIAGLLLAVVPLHVRDSHFGATDIAATLCVALALLAADRLGEAPDRRRGWVAGAWVGLAAAMKYNVVLVAVAIPVAVWSRRDRSVAPVAWAALSAVAVFFALNPYVLLDWSTFLEDFGFQAQHMRDGHGVDLGRGWSHHARVSLFYGLTPSVLLAAVLGGALSARAHRRWWPALAFALVFYLVMGRGRTVFMRYMLPLFPVLCIWAAYAVDLLLRRATSRPLRSALFAVLVLPAFLASTNYLRVAGRTDTREEARSWLHENAQPGDRILFVGGHGAAYGEPRLRGLEWCQVLTLEMEPDACPEGSHFTTLRMADQREGLAVAPEVDWIVAHDHALFLYSALHYRVKTDLVRWGERAAVFDPRVSPGETWPGVFDLQDAYFVPIGDFAGVAKPGPRIEIWKSSGNGTRG